MMLSTSNYEARKLGIRAGQPGFVGRQLARELGQVELKIVPTNFELYMRLAGDVRAVLKTYDATFEPVGCDESYLDLTRHLEHRPFMSRDDKIVLESPCQPCLRQGRLCEKSMDELIKLKVTQRKDYVRCNYCHRSLWHQFDNSPESAVREMRLKVYNATRLTCSAGIGPNRLVAKIASDMDKPNGQYRVLHDAEEVESFVAKLPVRKLGGIGKVSAFMLKEAFDISTVAELYDKRNLLPFGFKQNTLVNYLHLMLGDGSTTVDGSHEREAKSIGKETTMKDTRDRDEIRNIYQSLCERLEGEMKSEKLAGRTLILKLKTSNFQNYTRSKTYDEKFNDAETMMMLADAIWAEHFDGDDQSYRLVGIQMTNLSETTSAIMMQCPLCDVSVKSVKQLELHINTKCNFIQHVYNKTRK